MIPAAHPSLRPTPATAPPPSPRRTSPTTLTPAHRNAGSRFLHHQSCIPPPVPARNPSAVAVSQLTRTSPSTRLQPSTWTSRYAPQQPLLLHPWTALKLPLLSFLKLSAGRRQACGQLLDRTAEGASERSMDAEDGVAGAHTC